MAANWDKPVRKNELNAGTRKFAKRSTARMIRRMPIPLSDDDNTLNPNNRSIFQTNMALKTVAWQY